MAEKFNEFENYFVIDSMPLEVCKMARSSRSKICKEVDYAIPNKGFCANLKSFICIFVTNLCNSCC